MNKRIEVVKEEGKLNILIRAYAVEQKQKMLLLWIVLFSICGGSIFTQFFGDYDAGTKVFFGVYIAFWLFFEFKVIYAYRWRKFGAERIVVEEDGLILIKTIGKRGITQKYKSEEIKNVSFFKNPDGDFVKSMNTSYWNINKYVLCLNLENNQVPFGIDLENKAAKKIMNEINSALK